MGDPRKKRRRYSRPPHLWKIDRLAEDKEVFVKYGLKNKKEVWIARSKLGGFRKEARKLLVVSGEGGEKEKNDLLASLRRLGIETKLLEDVLALNVETLLDRRLQSVLFKKGFANTMRQARQFITHGHVLVNGSVINIPGYLVLKTEEEEIRLKRTLSGGAKK